jgi:hypothetical protein
MSTNIFYSKLENDTHYKEDDNKFNKKLLELEESKSEKKEENIIKKKIFLTISSLNRDWYNNSSETPYNYKVKINENIYNDEFLISKNLKNIVTISINTLIIPNRKLKIHYTTLDTTNTNNAIIIIDINKINDVNYGSNSLINNSLGVMHILTPISVSFPEFDNLEYKNINLSYKDYYNNPISNINTLEINMKNMLNNPINDIEDVLGISGIYEEGSGTTQYLVIETSTYFGSEYNIGNKIIIKNYSFRDNGYDEGIDFQNFINQDKGHFIVALESSSGSSLSHYNNRIKISIPHTIDTSSGQISIDSWYTDLKSKATIDNTSTYTNDTLGKLINYNLQTYLFVTVTNLEKENNITTNLI